MPSLTIFFEEGQENVSLGRWFAKRINAGLAHPHSLELRRSFGNVSIVIEGSSLTTAHLIVDGQPVALRALGGLMVARIRLRNDVEVHRIAYVEVPDMACTVDLTVVHDYHVTLGGIKQTVSKWTAADFDREFNRFSPVLTKQQQISRDSFSGSLRFGTEEELNSALLQALGTIVHLLASLRQFELLDDFSELRAGSVDLTGVLAYLKEDPRRLSKDPEGSIEILGERYTTDVNERELTRSSQVDIAPLTTLLEYCAGLFRMSSAPAAASVLLQYAASDLRRRFQTSTVASERQMEELLVRRMHSQIGGELQSQLQLLHACARQIVRRDNASNGLLWLRQSVRDFDLFQSSCFYALAVAFGFSHAQAMTHTGSLQRQDVTLLNGNFPGALQKFFSATKGWRDGSNQPSDYRPDLVVLLDGKNPVVLDAKFAIANSEASPLPSASLKEVQAYLDEFGLAGAVVIVPKVLSPAHLETDGYIELAGTDNHGRHRLLLGVPLCDSQSHASQLALKKAVERVANLA